MSVTAPERQTNATIASSRSPIPAMSGVAFPILMIAAILVTSTPDGNQSDQVWAQWIAVGSHRTSLILAGVLGVLASAALLVFVSAAWGRIGRVRQPLALLAGSVAAGLIAVGTLSLAAAAFYSALDSGPLAGASTLRLVQAVEEPMITVGAMPMLALAIVALSVPARAAGLFSRGMLVYSVVSAVLALGSFFFLPMIFPLVWVAVAGIRLSRR